MAKKLPKIEEIESFLKDYGWNFRRAKNAEDNEMDVVIAPVMLDDGKGVLLSFHVIGEFVMVSTLGFLKDVKSEYARELLRLNDTVKLAKIYEFSADDGMMECEVGFELWGDAWNKETFFAFMAMLELGVNEVYKYVKKQKIEHKTDFIEFTDKKK